jgi:uncharacterized membrane protein HdeD (DUF308 family)
LVAITLPTEVNMGTYEAQSSHTKNRIVRVFITRGLVAIVWSAVFAAASHSLTTGVTVGAGILLVIYPLIDAVASLIDARTQRGSARQLLLANASFSTLAAAGLGVVATGTIADVLVVFGIWAAISGAAQLTLALRRRAQLGNQWPMLLAGGVSVFAGFAYIFAASGTHPKLRMLVIYTAAGGIEFIIQALLLVRRRRSLAAVPIRP